MKVKDPVCGMSLEQSDAVATAQHNGKTFYFCSEECKETFVQNAEDYA